MNNKNNNENKEILGYCKSCKDPLLAEDDYVKNNGNIWCIYCYKVEHNIIEELDFEE